MGTADGNVRDPNFELFRMILYKVFYCNSLGCNILSVLRKRRANNVIVLTQSGARRKNNYLQAISCVDHHMSLVYLQLFIISCSVILDLVIRVAYVDRIRSVYVRFSTMLIFNGNT